MMCWNEFSIVSFLLWRLFLTSPVVARSPLLSKLVCNRQSPQRMLILASPFHPPNRKTSRQQLLPTFVDEKKDKERGLIALAFQDTAQSTENFDNQKCSLQHLTFDRQHSIDDAFQKPIDADMHPTMMALLLSLDLLQSPHGVMKRTCHGCK